METGARKTHSDLFIVRVWPEHMSDGNTEWRGKVQHVVSGETLFFHDWDTMLAFLRRQATDDKGHQHVVMNT